MRSDHLMAVLNYALEQSETSGIEVLDFGDNENGLNYEEQVEEIKSMIRELKEELVEGNTEVGIVRK